MFPRFVCIPVFLFSFVVLSSLVIGQEMTSYKFRWFHLLIFVGFVLYQDKNAFRGPILFHKFTFCVVGFSLRLEFLLDCALAAY